ncbi:MAG TPA: Crp/Fnr family transcriptional regulator, partial [Blastocatellia bacterium]|nr:Crp/Fnr family transcriptional regulator [Blastocatellia bacterium]
TPGLIHSVSPATKSRNGNGAARVVPMQDRQAARATIENDILASLPDEELNSLLPELVPITLNVGDVLFDFEERVRYVYFPNSGLVSLLSTMKDGATVEVSMIGKHGAADIFFLLDNNSTPYRAIVEIPGSAMRIRAEALRKHFDQSGQLQKLLLTYLYNKLLQTAQAAACNCFHSVKERLCRRLLEIADCLQSDDFRITQELLAVMLGVRRSGISVAAGILQNEKLIDYSRGRIALLDSAGLEAIACECYSIIKYDYKIRF